MEPPELDHGKLDTMTGAVHQFLNSASKGAAPASSSVALVPKRGRIRDTLHTAFWSFASGLVISGLLVSVAAQEPLQRCLSRAAQGYQLYHDEDRNPYWLRVRAP